MSAHRSNHSMGSMGVKVKATLLEQSDERATRSSRDMTLEAISIVNDAATAGLPAAGRARRWSWTCAGDRRAASPTAAPTLSGAY